MRTPSRWQSARTRVLTIWSSDAMFRVGLFVLAGLLLLLFTIQMTPR